MKPTPEEWKQKAAQFESHFSELKSKHIDRIAVRKIYSARYPSHDHLVLIYDIQYIVRASGHFWFAFECLLVHDPKPGSLGEFAAEVPGLTCGGPCDRFPLKGDEWALPYIEDHFDFRDESLRKYFAEHNLDKRTVVNLVAACAQKATMPQVTFVVISGRVIGDFAPRTFVIPCNEPAWIGRSLNCRIQVADPNSSDLHAVIFVERFKYGPRTAVIEPYDNSCAICINGSRCERRIPLALGDVLKIGDTSLRLTDLTNVPRYDQGLEVYLDTLYKRRSSIQ